MTTRDPWVGWPASSRPGPGVEADDLRHHAPDFLRALSTPGRRISPATRRSYLESLRQFAVFLDSNGNPPVSPGPVTRRGADNPPGEPPAPRDTPYPTNLSDIRKRDILDWLQYLDSHGVAASTLANRFGGLRAFFVWAVKDGLIEVGQNPMLGLERPKVTIVPPPFLRADDFDRLMATCDVPRGADLTRQDNFCAVRDAAVMAVLYGTGLRLSECANVRLTNSALPGRIGGSDLDLDAEPQPQLWVLGKGRKVRVVPLGSGVVKRLRSYLKAREKMPWKDEPWLWVGRQPSRDADGAVRHHFGSTGIEQAVKNRGQQAGLDLVLHPHLFRHSWAHKALTAVGEGRGTLLDVCRLGGWTSLRQLEARYGGWLANERAVAANVLMGLGEF